MLTDIKGFTDRTARQTHAENAQLLEQHDALLLPVVRAFGGTLVQKRGDALLVTFATPTAAVHCGMAIQDRLWAHNAPLPASAQLLVRVAVHLGEVLVRREGLIGEPAQVVAAVEAVTQAGEVVFTSAVRLAINRAEVHSEARGQLALPGGGELRPARALRPRR
jgi:serine/threonine-protein kinase